MKGIIRKVLNYDEMSTIVALHVKRFIGRSNSNIGLPTGSTPLGMYEELRSDYRLKWDNVKTFNLDEYVGIDKDHVQSYNTYMYRNLFSHIDIPTKNVHFPTDENYDNLIAKNGGLEVPTEAFTMGLKTIMDSKEIYLIAQGKSKWDIIREAFYGEITEKVPASILQRHENLTVLYCD